MNTSLFGKKYTKLQSETVEDSVTINLGFDTGKVKEGLMKQVAKPIPAFVRKELETIRKQFFGAAREKLEQLIKTIEELEQKLQKLNYE